MKRREYRMVAEAIKGHEDPDIIEAMTGAQRTVYQDSSAVMVSGSRAPGPSEDSRRINGLPDLTVLRHTMEWLPTIEAVPDLNLIVVGDRFLTGIQYSIWPMLHSMVHVILPPDQSDAHHGLAFQWALHHLAEDVHSLLQPYGLYGGASNVYPSHLGELLTKGLGCTPYSVAHVNMYLRSQHQHSNLIVNCLRQEAKRLSGIRAPLSMAALARSCG